MASAPLTKVSELLPILLGVRRKLDAEQIISRPRNKAALDSQVLTRDDHACRYCGFRDTVYNRVIPRDYATQNYTADNCVTVCFFCDKSLSLEHTGMNGGGTLIWMPEIAQAALNHIVRGIYVAKAEGGKVAEAANAAYEQLLARKAEAKKRFGSDDPLILGTVLLESLAGDEYQARAAKLNGLRLLVAEKHMRATAHGEEDVLPAAIKSWREKDGPYGNLQESDWQNLLAA
jgi:intracellular multiplication protein IcmJ